MKDFLLITPPFTQLNTPYPATAYLKGFLNTKNISSYQIDLGIEVILEIFSKKGVTEILNLKPENLSENTHFSLPLAQTAVLRYSDPERPPPRYQ